MLVGKKSVKMILHVYTVLSLVILVFSYSALLNLFSRVGLYLFLNSYHEIGSIEKGLKF